MKRFCRDTRGSTPLWAAFITVILCMFSVLTYTGATLYSAYRTAQTELERAASISIDMNMENRNVRDLVMDIPQESTLADLENNLSLSGLTRDADGAWKRFSGEQLVYEFKNLHAEANDDVMEVSGEFVLPLPWAIGNQMKIAVPISFQTKVIYLD
ncbi:MAG TPA: hypothetical protein VHP14_07500 [Anaerolineales bacterium]|nr:hypothetical protein [Anaerolineales bacterium]